MLEERTVGKTNWIYGYCYGQLGQEAKAREILDIHLKLAQKQYISPAFIASIYWSLGEKPRLPNGLRRKKCTTSVCSHLSGKLKRLPSRIPDRKSGYNPSNLLVSPLVLFG
ncbi:MAG: hypothetical protein H6561_01605 [Lewinellaceae bacterium]|nr:hypothetical protein [Lewinellaceae bacterium]